jgi:hypothetical protein
MTLNNLFGVNSIISFVYGIALLLLPGTMLGLYGVPSSPGAQVVAQLLGGVFLGIGLLNWLVRGVSDSAALRAIILSLLVTDALGAVVSVWGTLSGGFNTFGWSAVLVYLVLALGYAYFWFMKPVTANA